MIGLLCTENKSMMRSSFTFIAACNVLFFYFHSSQSRSLFYDFHPISFFSSFQMFVCTWVYLVYFPSFTINVNINMTKYRKSQDWQGGLKFFFSIKLVHLFYLLILHSLVVLFGAVSVLFFLFFLLFHTSSCMFMSVCVEMM